MAFARCFLSTALLLVFSVYGATANPLVAEMISDVGLAGLKIVDMVFGVGLSGLNMVKDVAEKIENVLIPIKIGNTKLKGVNPIVFNDNDIIMTDIDVNVQEVNPENEGNPSSFGSLPQDQENSLDIAWGSAESAANAGVLESGKPDCDDNLVGNIEKSMACSSAGSAPNAGILESADGDVVVESEEISAKSAIGSSKNTN